MADPESPSPAGTAADAAVHAFLAAHTAAPIYVGFGSMPISDQHNVWLRHIMAHVAFQLKLPLVLQLPPLPSAASADAEHQLAEPVRALKRPRLPAALPADGNPNADWLAAHVLDVSALPHGGSGPVHVCHARLFARVAVVIHHGGSGTTHCAFRYVVAWICVVSAVSSHVVVCV
jgi:hypothetical protein